MAVKSFHSLRKNDRKLLVNKCTSKDFLNFLFFQLFTFIIIFVKFHFFTFFNFWPIYLKFHLFVHCAYHLYVLSSFLLNFFEICSLKYCSLVRMNDVNEL